MLVTLDLVPTLRIIEFSIIRLTSCYFLRRRFLIRMKVFCLRLQILHLTEMITPSSSGGSPSCFQLVVTNCSVDRLAMGTPALLIDLVESTFPKRSLVGGSFADVKVIGNLFFLSYQGRNDEVRCKLFVMGMLRM